MKVLPFRIPKPENEFVRHQVDDVVHFYDKLHQHPEVQLTVIVKGEGSLVVGDYIGPFQAGEIYLLGSNAPHVFRNTDHYYQGSATHHAYSESLFYDPKLARNQLDPIHEFAGLCPLLDELDGCYRISDPYNYIRERILSLGNTSGILRIIKSLEILVRLSEEKVLHRLNAMDNVKHYSEREGKRMENVMKFVMDQCQRPISLNEVAEVAHMNKEAFCRFFKERTRKTFTEFLCEVRITRACHLLADKNASISQIALDSGFNNLSYFNRVFKEIKQLTPRAYRKAIYTETRFTAENA